MHGQPGVELFRSSLSVAGVDGSLREQLRDVAHQVIGKTGTMRGVRTLTGYAMGSNGPSYAFAVMFNGYQGSSSPYRRIQDQFCRILLKYAR
jgi:D-alanyl-D-alanine carboxypeptidase/D-alanyl-D-alanine-endopeptidase (penicillin-binding protein 4)